MVEKERWQILCDQALAEQDPNKVAKLVAEIDLIIAEEKKVKAIPPPLKDQQ